MSSVRSTLLLSIHPRFVDAILNGTKQVELRRRRPRVSDGRALIYATAPRMELVASFQVASLVQGPLDLLWRSVRKTAGISRLEFDAYFSGLETGVAIGIGGITRLPTPIPLRELRRIWAGFQPPQGFRYVDWSQIAPAVWAEARNAA